MRTPSITLDKVLDYCRQHPREVTGGELLVYFAGGWDLPPRVIAEVKGRINEKANQLVKQGYLRRASLNSWIIKCD